LVVALFTQSPLVVRWLPKERPIYEPKLEIS
jgi:hypothetical protein